MGNSGLKKVNFSLIPPPSFQRFPCLDTLEGPAIYTFTSNPGGGDWASLKRENRNCGFFSEGL
jgi:hypothetical protein